MRVHHLNCGTLRPPSQRLVNGVGSPLRPARLVCHCLLVETGDGLLFVDSGIGMGAVTEPQAWRGDTACAVIRGQISPTRPAVEAFFHAETDPHHPHCSPGLALFQHLVQHERDIRRHNQQRLRELVTESDKQVTMFSAHDPTEFDRLAAAGART